jgi:recombination protein RecA
VSKSKTSLIFTNQIRMKIGVMFGSPETTSGGNALKFYSSVRMDIRRIGALKDGEKITGNRTKVKVVKNKVAPPFRIAEFDLIYGEGISYEGDLLDLGTSAEIIKKSGTWYSYGDERLGQGKEAARAFLKENSKIRAELDKKVRAHFGIGPSRKSVPEAEKGSARTPDKVTPPPGAATKGRPGSVRVARK